MMREMNDYVARRALFRSTTPESTPITYSPRSNSTFISNTTNLTKLLITSSITNSYSQSNDTATDLMYTTISPDPSWPPFNGTLEEAQELFINRSYNLCTIVILFGVTRFIALYLALYFFSRAASNQAKRVKLLFFKSLLRQEVAWFERNRTGDFAIRITSDLTKFEDGIGEKIALCLNALFAWTSSLISSFYYGWELTLVCLVLVPLTIFITTVIAEFQATYSIKESSSLSRAFNVCHEVISSIRTVQAFSGQQKEADRFKQGLDSAYMHGLYRNIFAGLNLGFTWMSGYLGFAICLLYSTKFYKPEYYGQYDEAHIITILWSAAGCVFLLNRMMPFIEIIQMARGSASNLFAVIERRSEIDVTSETGLKPHILEASVKFDCVCFTYPIKDDSSKNVSASTGKPICETDTGESDDETDCSSSRSTLYNMSMDVKPGQTIALVGPSGSGKSTALALLQRFYEIDSGSITIGGHELRELNLAWLRGQFGVVTQEPVLFDMSIADNIRLGARPGQTVSDFDVEQAAKSANAHAFIARLPQGYETRAGTRGVQLSGGQKQRIAIARALIRQPKILLLDEATSALDLESESIVQKALDQARIGRTTFIVAHRLSTVRNADKILVFDKGTIVEMGTHDELLQQRGLYFQINDQQRQGIDVAPAHRRNSQVSATLGNTGTCAVTNTGEHHFARESRSLSICSTTGKYATGGGFGAAGHGGNGEGVDGGEATGSCEPNRFADDYEYYDRNEEEDESESEDQETARKLLLTIEETQASVLDCESLGGLALGGAGCGRGKRGSSLSFWKVLKFIRPSLVWSLVGIFTSLLMGLCIPISALIIGDIATIFSTDNANDIREGLFSHGLLYAGLALFAFLVSFVQVFSFGLAGERIGCTLRLRGFQAILGRNIGWFDHKRNSPGSICARLASDVGNVQSITGNRTAVIFQSISIFASTFIFAFYFNLKFSAICALFVAILLVSTVMQARYAGKLAVSNRNQDSQIGKIVLESSANIKTLVSLHQEGYFIERCEELLNKDCRSSSLDNHMRLSLESLKYAMTAISKGSSFYFAATMLRNDEISIDVIFKLIEIILYGLTEASKSLIFISDLEKARRGTQNLYKLIHDYSQQSSSATGAVAGGSERGKRRYLPKFLSPMPITSRFLGKRTITNDSGYRRLVPEIRVEPAALDPHKSLPTLGWSSGDEGDTLASKCSGNISFNGVRFHYPSRPDACVLRSLSFEISAGKSIALVGRSGCGKSTVVQLLERFYEYLEGSIQVDGKELRRLPTEWVRRQIGLVSQEPSLLSYTIGDNIRYGDNSRQVAHEEVVRAAQLANIHDFIMTLPDGYETKLSESNSLQLSGGQKQRIAIARALVRQAPILVFDEATSALDTKSERIVQEALDRARQGRTSIIIAHRLSTIKSADRILVLRDGLVVEQGSHNELLERRGEYYCLYKTQSK